MTRILLPLLATFTLALPATALAANDGTSNTIMVAELRQRPVAPSFMDYTDDVMLTSTRRP
ncbi:hypothetical protein [Solirubrobacter soli]|uniref:hypothetical protein n=1 Tax=Solirubrobacter soli TaxID=363832 RepID=UPI0012FB40D1|nr:hypothetical protein [Solirubrobacter soli]